MKNYYRILNIDQGATAEEIKRSYYALAKRYHPDVNKGDRAASKRFDDVREAYTILSDADARAEYDRKLAKETQTRITASDLNDIDSIIARKAAENEQRLREIQFRAQVQAEARAQIEAQVKQAKDKIAKESYDRGYKDGHALADRDMMRLNDDIKHLIDENNKLKKRRDEFRGDRSDLEQELFDRDRIVAQLSERIEQLEAQLEWVRTATKGNDALITELDDSLDRSRALDEKLGSPAFALSGLSPELQSRRNRMKAKLDELNKQLEALTLELENINEQSKRKLELEDGDNLIAGMENRAAQWAKKQSADRKLAKTTLYGALGVLIWATDEEIRDSYAKLKARYESKDDSQSKARLTRLNEAYEILSDPTKRRRYNTSIGCPEERIQFEQKLIRENQAAQAEYRKKLASEESWGIFDELSSLALAGDADAQNRLGEAYYRGETVERDFSQAAYWFREAFEQKHPAAIYNLGICYLNGEGIARNTILGQGLIRQAKNLGYTG